jgi:hypothetical protein
MREMRFTAMDSRLWTMDYGFFMARKGARAQSKAQRGRRKGTLVCNRLYICSSVKRKNQ